SRRVSSASSRRRSRRSPRCSTRPTTRRAPTPTTPPASPDPVVGGRARLLLLLPTRTSRTEDFIDAARTLGVDLVCASEKPSTLETLSPDSLLTVDFADPATAAAQVSTWSAERPLAALV